MGTQVKLHTIVSGGQTGVDRGALDAARDLGLKRGGWAPKGWRAEDGPIPMKYRIGLVQNGSDDYRIRTRANVEASSGTLILSFGDLPIKSGSMMTANVADTLKKPCLHLRITRSREGWWQLPDDLLLDFLERNQIVTLNVAGPRESREPGIQGASRIALANALRGDGFGWNP